MRLRDNSSNGKAEVRQNGKPDVYDTYVKKRRYLPPDLRPRWVAGGQMTISDQGTISLPDGTSKFDVTDGGLSIPGISPFEQDRQNYLKAMADDLDILMMVNTFGRGITSRTVSVTTTPTLIVKANQPKGYIIVNPLASAGLTTSGTLFPSLLRTTAGSPFTSSAVGVANYDRLIAFLDISATVLTPAVKIDVQSQDPISLNWATAQFDIFSAPTAVGTYYANLGTLGVDSNLRLKATLVGGTSSTFSVGYLLKDGLPGGSSGLANTVFLGGPGVSTVSGYSLNEGAEFKYYFLANAELWGVSFASGGVNLKVFELA